MAEPTQNNAILNDAFAIKVSAREARIVWPARLLGGLFLSQYLGTETIIPLCGLGRSN